MTRLEVLMTLYALQKLMDKELYEEAKEVIDRVIEEAERTDKDKKD